MGSTRKVSCSTPFSCLQIAKEFGMVEAKDKNFVYSPFSIELALGLLTNGATGSTKTELLTFLGSENLDDLNSGYEQLLHTFPQTSDKDPILSLVGGVWFHNSLSLKPSFIANANKVYNAKAEPVDCEDQVKAQEAVEKVNQWAKDATRGLIHPLLPEHAFNQGIGILLANAFYFKGRWEKEFRKSYTKDSKFYLLDGNCVEVPFMSSYLDRYISFFEEFSILRLSYSREERNKKISMYIILPNKRDGLWSIVEKVGSDPLFLEKFVSQRMHLHSMRRFEVPKFKILHDFEVSEVLQGIGLQLPFAAGAAKFDEMVNSGPSLHVSSVIHKACIEVNEEGTEAAAVTSSGMSFSMGDDEPTVDFVADHPFMFMIRDDMSGAVMFMGHVVNPLLQ